jgi:hypothetical protein
VVGLVALASLGASLVAIEGGSPLPPGEQAVSYGDAVIDVPSTWVVQLHSPCHVYAPGEVVLGPVKATFCPREPRLPNDETIVHMGPVVMLYKQGHWLARAWHGLQVLVPPRRTSTLELQWVVPSLGIQIQAGGPRASAVLHSLHAGALLGGTGL